MLFISLLLRFWSVVITAIVDCGIVTENFKLSIFGRTFSLIYMYYNHDLLLVLNALLRSVKITFEFWCYCLHYTYISYAVNLSCSNRSPEHESIHILSVDEKNKLGAKIIKAEMMGNMVRLLDVVLENSDQIFNFLWVILEVP